MEFPKHLVLHISHNDHKSNYETAEAWATRNDDTSFATWASDEERAKAIAQNEIWTVQWYPNTPVGFCCVAASTLEAALEAAQYD